MTDSALPVYFVKLRGISLLRATVVVLIAVALSACSTAEPTAAPATGIAPSATSEATPSAPATQAAPYWTPPTPRMPAKPPDAAAQVACRHWRNVFAEAVSGELTDAEIRDNVTTVHDAARMSKTGRIADRSADLMRAAAKGYGDRFVTAAVYFGKSCSEAGA